MKTALFLLIYLTTTGSIEKQPMHHPQKQELRPGTSLCPQVHAVVTSEGWTINNCGETSQGKPGQVITVSGIINKDPKTKK